jgi:hypothetical protein
MELFCARQHTSEHVNIRRTGITGSPWQIP